MTIWHLHASS